MRAAAPKLAMLALLVGGACGRAGEGTGVLRFSNWGGATEDNAYQKTLDGLVEDFERSHGIEIKFERIPGSQEYVRKMLLNFVAGAQPEVMALDASSAAVFINNGVLQDLRPFIERDKTFRQADYWPNVWQIDARGEAVYAIPGDFTPMVLYYNKQLFDEAGVPYPREGWTFDAFLAAAQRLTRRDAAGRVQQYGFKFDNWMPGWIVWLWNNGGDVLSPDGERASGFLDSRANVETVTFLRDMVNRHQVAPALSEATAAGVDLFANGQAAMMISGHWVIPFMKPVERFDPARIGVIHVPTNLPKPVTVMYEVGFAMPRGIQNPEKAWELIKYMSSRRYQSAYQATGIAICARRDVATERAKDPREKTFLEIVQTARGPWGARVVGYDFVEAEGKKMMQNVLSGADPQRALQETARRIDAYFKVR